MSHVREVEAQGRTVDDAVAKALQALGASREEVVVEVLEEAARPLWGLIGGREARVRVRLRDWRAEKLERARSFLSGLLEHFGTGLRVVAVAGEDGTARLDVEGDELGPLIGRHGQTLEALQHLVNAVVNDGQGEWMRIVVDVGGYRARREARVVEMAMEAVEQVRRRKRAVSLPAMNAAERRVVHLTVKAHPDVVSESEGDEPLRRVVIRPAGGSR